MAADKTAQLDVAQFLRDQGGRSLVEVVMRTLLNHSWLRISLLAAVAACGLPVAGATAARSDAQLTRVPAVSAYNRPAGPTMFQFGADSTALNAQDLTLPLIARIDTPVFAEAAWSVATVSAVGDGLQTSSAAPAPPVSSTFSSSRLPRSSPWSGMVATVMLIAFFLFRRAQ